MSAPDAPPDALRRALAAVKDMKERLERAEAAAHEPIAIIGAGCRLPGGASSPDAYWELLRSGTDAVGQVPADRWDSAELYDPDPDAAGKISTDQGGFVDWPVDQFDAAFFGISPREAAALDPQQRLLLEVAWEALEDAGIRADELAGSATGVFVGIGTTDYANLQLRHGDPIDVDTYFGTGVALSVAAGRISYFLGLRGPALAIDTACSSSLVSIAHAVQSLRSGSCRAALAGGVSLMLDPMASVFSSRFRALSPSGRCRTFSADADGYVRGEGCGLLVLKRLSDAVADGNRIMAVVRGAAVNHDGRSSGLTVPNGAAQRELIEQALADASLGPLDVDMVEVHGTGTEFGDPIEVRALDAVYGRGRPAEAPLLVGTAKTNIGHLEAAAGVAGVLKVVLALQHEHIPAHLHFDTPTRHVDWDSIAVSVAAEARPWPRGARRRRAAVSAFGFSGTNAHLILEEAPEVEPVAWSDDRSVQVLALSARDEVARRELAQRYAEDPSTHGSSLAELAWTTQTGRARFPHRLAVVAGSRAEASDRLQAWLAGSRPIGVVQGEATQSRPELAFVCSGEPAGRTAVGQELYHREPVFRAALDDCRELLHAELERPLLDVLFADDGEAAALIRRPSYAQPALLAVGYGLSELWRAWGVEPGAVAGHATGELVAACVAGVLGLEDALRLMSAYGRLIELHPGTAFDVSALAELSTVAADLTYRMPKVTFVSSVTGAVESGAVASADYWVGHALAVDRFDDAASTLLAAGFGQFVELGARSTLLARLEGAGAAPDALHASFQDGRDEREQMAEALAGLWVGGFEPDWAALHAGPRPPVSAPTYPFQRRRHWFTSGDARPAPERGSRLHPLVRRRIESPLLAGHAYEASAGPDGGVDDLAAPALLEMVVAAARDAFGVDRRIELGQVSWPGAEAEQRGAGADGDAAVQVTFGDLADGRADFGVHSRRGPAWQLDLSGIVLVAAADAAPAQDAALMPAVVEDASGDGWAVARVALPAGEVCGGHLVHPALLDGALALVGEVLADGEADSAVYVPARAERYEVIRSAGDAVQACVVAAVTIPDAGLAVADVDLRGDDGALVASLRGLTLRRTSAAEGNVGTVRRFSERLASTPAADRVDLVREETRAAIASVLGLGRDEPVAGGVELAELGLDSLMAVDLRNTLQRTFGIPIDATAAFEWPTLDLLAGHLAREVLAAPGRGAGDAALVAGGGASLAPIPPVSRLETLPASPAQQRFLFMAEFDPTAAVYNLSSAIRVAGALDPDALDAAFTEVVRRHEALRTGFDRVDDQVVQVIAAPEAVHVEHRDLGAIPDDELPQMLTEMLEAEAARPFDIGRDVKLRGMLVRLAPELHVLLTTTHHVAADGWSVGRLVGELEELYGALAGGGAAQLRELPIQYADYSVWEREQLGRPELQEQLDYWRAQLAGDLPVLALPADRPRPAVRTYGAGSVRFDVPPALLAAIRASSREAGVTPFMLLLASYIATLARHSGQGEIVVGTVSANRSRRELEEVVGPFVTTLALRVGVDPHAPFADLLEEVKRVAIGAYARQDIPFDRVVEAVSPPRDLSRSPIFQTMFILQNVPVPELKLGDLEVELIPLHSRAVDTDLTVELLDLPSGMTGELKYNRDLFDADTMERLVSHWLQLLGASTVDRSQPVRALPMLTPSEEHELLVGWDGPTMPLPSLLLHELVSSQVVRTPDDVAVRMGDATLSYRELDARSDLLAGHLCRLGVKPEDRIGVAVERSPMMVVALLGILKAGAAYLPLDPTFPRDRLAYMVADAGCRTIVTSASVDLVGIGRPGDTVVDLDTDWPAIEAGAMACPLARGGELAYTIYTSGSTGRPKGVEIGHRNVVSFLLAMQREPGLAPDDVVLGLTTLSFDISVLEIFLPLITGAQLVLASREETADGVALARLIERSRCTLLQATPTTWSMLLASGWTGRAGLTALCGGEEMSRDLADRLLTRCEVLWNMFGPTETTVWSTAGEVARGGTGPVPIGRPIANTVCRVLDPAGGLAPVGVAGELFIGGAGVARGYRDRPDLDAERFVPDPFGSGRLYRTGDLARWTRDGRLEFLGRLDQQVKVRGHRIELGEIEHHLATHGQVQAAAVVTWQAAPGDVRLVGYYVPVSGPVESGALRDHLRLTLPAYMVPSAFVPIEALPLTPNQKIDRSRLPAPQPVEDRTVRTAETELQGELVAIWADVLGGTVGVDDDFFDLGGHSLLATQIVSRVRAVLGVEVPVRVVFEHPTVAGLADWVEAARITTEIDALLPQISPVGRDRPLPLTASQERMWFMHELLPDSAGYNMPGAIRLRGPLDVGALAASIDDLVVRHESLRTTFPMEEGRPVQRIAPRGHVDLEVIDRRSVPEQDRLDVVIDEVCTAAERVFRLEELPLLRCTLYVLAPDDHVLFINMHHIIGDQWAFGVIGRDLTASYNARLVGTTAELAPLTVQFADYAHWHREWVDGGAVDAQLEYWRRQLAGYPTIDLPTDRPRPPILTGRGAKLFVPVPDHILDGINRLCVQHRVSPFMVLLAALDLLVHRYANAHDIVIGTPIANRNWLESEALLGAFVNTVVIRTDVSGDPTFAELLARVQRVSLDAYANQDAPFATVVNELHPVRDLSRSPIFQIFLNVLNAPVELLKLDGVAVEVMDIDRGAAQFDLTVTADLKIARSIDLEYSTDLFDRTTMERLGGHLLTVLQAVTADPGLRVGDVVMLSDDERAELEAAWSGPVVEVEDGVAAHTLVERQVARTPDHVAVRSQAEVVTYHELDARANRLARHLIERGVTKGDIVGIHLERSVDMVVAVLAALKAGAAYLPLDPALPTGRLTFMLEDTATGLVISRGQTRLSEDADPAAPTLVLLDADAEAIAACSPDDPARPVDSHGRAHVIYTSGSTGRPKGVDVEHHSVVSFLQAMAVEPGLSADDIVLGGTTLAFDPSVLELFLPLMHGAQLVIADRPTMVDPGALADLLRREGVTIMQATPTTWRMLVDAGWKGEPGLTALYGGEPMPPDLLAAMLERCGSLWNLYGPTETTVWATVHRVQGAAERVRGAVPVGRPVDNTRCYVLDPYGHLQPVGAPGELHIGGEGVARGYLNRVELTAERFVPDPFAADPAARMYRTGDLARLLPDGDLDLLGRVDHQVKIRGHRIELGEIEQTLSSHPLVRAAAVTTWTPAPSDVRLAAYYIPDGEHAVDADELRSFLRVSLPAYMIPAAYVEMDAFPLTSSNKVARNQLPPPTIAPLNRSRRGPETPIQAELVQIWSEVLGQSDISIDDDFFDLGGHSLLAARVFAEMERSTGRRIPLFTLFQAPTIEDLARRYDESWTEAGEREHGWTSLIAMQPEGTRPPFFYVSPFLITILSFSHLARCMRPDQPFFLFQPQGMDGDHPVHERVEDMAAHYISEMRQVQETGPYRIGGHCAGAWVAFEMALQLQREGEEVALLLAVDAEPPGVTPPAVPLSHVAGRLRSYWRDGALKDSLRWQVRVRRERYISRRFGSGEAQRLAALRFAHAEAHRRYEADGVFDGDLVLVRSEDWAGRNDKDWHLQWQDRITGELVLDTVEGSHGDLVANTTASALAEKIRAAVDRSASLLWLLPLLLAPALTG